MTAAQKFSAVIIKNWFYFIAPLLFILISLVLIIHNGSFLFEYKALAKNGDQRIYYDIAYKFAHFEGLKSYYTLGYPLFYLPFILITGIKSSWTSIMPYVISLQSLILIPASAYLIFENKTRKNALITFLLLSIYYLAIILRSDDILTKYNFFGLIPLSEPLSIFLLLFAYKIYLSHFKRNNPDIKLTVLLAALVAWGILTRNISLILYLPLFLELLLNQQIRKFLNLVAITSLFYFPQLIYNFLVSGSLFFNGYVWSSKLMAERNSQLIESLYGVKSSSLFSIKYFFINIMDLFGQYLPLVLLGCLNLLKRNRLAVLVVIFSLANLIFYLSYWWSKADGLIDRFLMPNVFLLLYVYKNRQITYGLKAQNIR